MLQRHSDDKLFSLHVEVFSLAVFGIWQIFVTSLLMSLTLIFCKIVPDVSQGYFVPLMPALNIYIFIRHLY